MLLYFRELDELQEQLVGSEGKLSAIRKVSASHTLFQFQKTFLIFVYIMLFCHKCFRKNCFFVGSFQYNAFLL